ncbi:MAG: hypothetical protein KDK91_11500, partial [Gammaproteobacteria bacterium]|nr:hypothetical protein [Gammaproteobacteria bacterium]
MNVRIRPCTSRYARRQHRHQHGQSLVEALIACTLVLVPLYLAVPLLGKYLDIKQTAVQAARYEAWEYTVWQDGNDAASGTIRSNFNALTRGRQPYKLPQETHFQAENRFFGVVGTEPDEILRIGADDGLSGNRLTAASVNPLWKDHRREALFTG